MSDAVESVASQLPKLATPIPEIYIDGGGIEVSPVTVTVALATGQRPSAVIRMSPVYAKMFALLLKKYLKQAEEQWGESISVPEVVLKDRDISLDDW